MIFRVRPSGSKCATKRRTNDRAVCFAKLVLVCADGGRLLFHRLFQLCGAHCKDQAQRRAQDRQRKSGNDEHDARVRTRGRARQLPVRRLQGRRPRAHQLFHLPRLRVRGDAGVGLGFYAVLLRIVRDHRAHLARDDEVPRRKGDRLLAGAVLVLPVVRGSLEYPDRPCRTAVCRRRLYRVYGMGLDGVSSGRFGPFRVAGAGVFLPLFGKRNAAERLGDRNFHAVARAEFPDVVCAPQKPRAPVRRRGAPHFRQKTFARQTRHAEYVKGRFTD